MNEGGVVTFDLALQVPVLPERKKNKTKPDGKLPTS